jgi:hypothetical protein
MKRKLLSILTLLCLTVSSAWAAVVASGSCGTGVTYSLDDGVMTISGSGAMEDYGTPPWKSKTEDIKSVVIEDGVTHIGNYAFKDCSNLTTVTIGSGVTSIGRYVFRSCSSLTSVVIPANVTSIGNYAFKDCSKLTTVTLNSNPFIDASAFPGGATVTMNLTANAAGGANWMTFYNMNHNFQADVNTQVFKVELSGTGLKLHEVTDKIVTENTAVVLKTTGGDNPVMTKTESTSGNSQTNRLKGVDDAEGKTSDGKMFVLNYTAANGVGFYRLKSGEKLGVGKAYLTYSGALAPEFLFFEEDSADAIVSLLGETGEGAGAIYNLAGQRIQKMQRGINIVNGKKIIK